MVQFQGFDVQMCCLFRRAGQTRSPLCHMPESRHKDCQPRETQWVGTDEGKVGTFYTYTKNIFFLV